MKPKQSHNYKLKSTFLPRFLSLGPLELFYIINFTKEELLDLNLEMDSLNSINQLSFLKDSQAIWNKVQLITNNYMINLLLYINKTNEQKSYIDYISFESPEYSKEENALSEMFATVNEFHFLFLNEQPLYLPSEFSITLMIIGDKQIKQFKIGKPRQKNSNQIKNDDSKHYENSCKGKPIKVSIKESSFNQIILKCHQYEYFIVDINDAILIQPIDTFIELLTFMKIEYNSNIIIKFRNVNEHFISHEEMVKLNKIYLLTDIFIFDYKDAINLFNQHYQTFTTNKKNIITIDEKNLLEYFASTITCGGALSLCNSKIGLFVDDNNNKIEIVEVPNNGQVIKVNYDFKPYPKINHKNVELVQQYKTFLIEDNEKIKSIFFGAFIGRLCFNRDKVKGIEVFYPSYLVGIEIVKRILELRINNLPYPTYPEFYLVKLTRNDIEAEIKKIRLMKKEGKFILDCTNSEKSKMNYYVPLFDYNLHEYFSSNYVQKELLNKGFINSKGFVNYDPMYHNVMKKKVNLKRSISTNKKREPECVYSKYVNRTKEHRNRILKSVPPTNQKLPVGQCEVMDKLKMLPNCKHNHLKNANKKCEYCYLSEKSIILEEKEIAKRKQMQLRKY